jgi:hypothetical protein
MSAVDAPPGVAFAGEAAGEFVALRRPHRLARRVFLLVCGLGVATIALAARRIYAPSAELLLVAPLVCMSIAGVGLAVRRARLRVDADGIRWGWRITGFRMGRERLSSVVAYRDAIAVLPRRGSAWYLSARDWDRFGDMVSALRRAKLPFEVRDTRAPLQARLQSYGAVLDLLLLLAAAGAMLALAAAGAS